MSTTITTIKSIISEEITTGVHSIAGMFGIEDADKFAQELLIAMGIIDRTGSAPVVSSKPKPRAKAPAKKAEAETEAEAEAETEESSGETKTKKTATRKRTVTASAKEEFLALDGATKDLLKKVDKAYKDATDEEISSKGGDFIGFAKAYLATPPAPEPPKEKAVKAKRPVKNFVWTDSAKKLFNEIVKTSGGEVTDALKTEFTLWANAKTKEEYVVIAPVGHMRTFLVTKGAEVPEEVEEDVPVATKAPVAEAEDLEEFDHDGETLLIGIPSGKIYRATTGAGDQLIGVAGQGPFKSVVVPSE